MVVDYWKEGKWVNLPVINPSFTHLQLSLNSFGLEEGVEDELIWKFNPMGSFLLLLWMVVMNPICPGVLGVD